MRALEAPNLKRTSPVTAYSLTDVALPFALTFAQRRQIVPMDQRLPSFATSSDGPTTGNNGSGGGNEEFDWINDD